MKAASKPLMNPALRNFWQARGYHIKALYGGRASSKTWDAAAQAIMIAMTCKGRFLCTREFQNRIDDSVYTVLVNTIDRLGVSWAFDIQKTTIVCNLTGHDFLFYGRARNFEQIKGTEGVTVHWAEECEALTKEQYNVIDATISRNEGAQHWLIFNPRLAPDFAYQLVTSGDPSILARKINFDENPFLGNTMRGVIERCKLQNEEDYRHIYLGEPLSDEDNVVIKRRWIDAALDAHIKLGFAPSGHRMIGFDVADDGEDKCANVEAYGSVVMWADEWKAQEDELLQSCTRTYRRAWDSRASITYDSIGVGAHCGSKFVELNKDEANYGYKVPYAGFNAGGKVDHPEREYAHGRKNEDQFSNIKAQKWWEVADRFRKTYEAVTKGIQYPTDELISISSECPLFEKLKNELSTPRRDFDANGRCKVESKKDLAARDVPSPNLADAFIMCFAGAKLNAAHVWGALAK